MSAPLVGGTVGVCVYIAVGLASPRLHPLRHTAAAALFIVAILVAAQYV